MKRLTLIILAIVIASAGIVVAKITTKEVKSEQFKTRVPVLAPIQSDVTSWD